jgi:transcriptional regulator NrdR family protein
MSGQPPKDGTTTRGLECPRCGCRHFYVIRTWQTGKFVCRRRQCRHCGRRVTTQEKVIADV